MSDNFKAFKEKAKLLSDSSEYLVNQTNMIVKEYDDLDLDNLNRDEMEELLNKMTNLQNKISYEQKEYDKFLNEYDE